jgi:hypothetical protein
MEPKVYYCVHNSPSLLPILSQINAVHTTPFHLSEIHDNIIHPSIIIIIVIIIIIIVIVLIWVLQITASFYARQSKVPCKRCYIWLH